MDPLTESPAVETPVEDAALADQPEAPTTVDPRKEVARWKQRISKSRKLRKDWENDFDVKTAEEFYLGKHWKGLKAGEKSINHFLATIRVTMPNLLYDQPKFLTRPKPGPNSPASAEKAKAAEGVLNSIAEQDDNLRTASRLALLQNFFRIGVIKCVYDPKLVDNPNGGQPIFKQDPMGNEIYDPQTGQPATEVDPQTGQPLTEPMQIVSDDTYRFEWVDARHMLLPDEGPDPGKWPWIGEEVEVSLEDAKADERFPQELRDKFVAAGKKKDEPGETTYRDDDNEDFDPMFRYVEIYDKRHAKHFVVCEDQKIDEFLVDEPTPDGIEDHPYAILPGWFAVTGPDPSPWPLPYTSPWVELQKEYNISRQQQIEGGKRSARKVLYDKTTFEDEDEALKMLQSSKDMEGVMILDSTRPPVMMQESDLNAAIYKSSSNIMMDWHLVSGETGEKIGTSEADTATQASIINQASNLRDADLQKEVTNWLKVAGKKMLQLVRKTLTLQLYVNIRGMDDKMVDAYLMSTYGIQPQALQLFPALKLSIVQSHGQNRIEAVTREDLQGEYNIDITPGSTRPRTLSTERSQLLEFASLFAQNPSLALVRPLVEALAKTYEQIDDSVVEALTAMATQLIQAQQTNAGRQQGGNAGQPQNVKGSGMAAQNGHMGQVAQGTELM